ncbi:MAG: aspartate aminotransferase family protein [Chloroflexi bacterium]|nr:aspartate aminotransferase family protein [Chloroflexota bacterium]
MRREELQALDQAHLLHPHAVVGQPLPPLVLVRGKGALVWDADGKEYIDGTGGLWLNTVGHGREELARAAADQIAKLEYYSSFGDLSNEPSIRLGERLAALAPAHLNTIHFTSGGSEGTETALKLARLAQFNAGKTARTSVLMRADGYHGSSNVSMNMSGIERLKQGFGPALPGFVQLSAPRASSRADVDALVEEVERAIEETGADNIAAFIGEPVQGVGGVVPPPEGYWLGVQEVLRRHGVLLIADEVVTGFGRTGRWFGSETYGIEPDIMVTAKALTSGYIPMGAVFISDRLKAMLDGATFAHGFTYNGHPVAAAVALANLDIMEREGLVARAAEMGPWLLGRLRELEALTPVVEVRGAGMMFGVQLDRDGAAAVAAARSAGVLVRGGGTMIILCPPLVLRREEGERIVAVLAEALQKLD